MQMRRSRSNVNELLKPALAIPERTMDIQGFKPASVILCLFAKLAYGLHHATDSNLWAALQ